MQTEGKEGAMKKRLPFGLDVPGLFEWAWRLAALLLIIASFYLNTVYATKAESIQMQARIDSVEKKFEGLPAQVEAERLTLQAHMMGDAEVNRTLTSIREDLTGVKATQRESMKNIEANFNRVFNKIDNLPR